jgi:pimeloyl-ACP methyl ester carboxylesterase
VAAVIETLDLQGVTLVGHSMGCGEAVRYVSRHGPARVHKIVLIAPALPFLMKTHDNPGGVEPALLDAVRDLWRHDFDKWMDDNAQPFFTPQTSAGTVRWALSMTQAVSLRAAIGCNIAVAETDFRAELKEIATPVLVIQGDRDVSGPVEFTGGPTADLIAGAQLSVYEGAPHGLFATHVDRLNAELAAFISP